MMRLNLRRLVLPALLTTVGIRPVWAQHPARPPVYRNLVMEGGGIRGIAYGGALAELERQGQLRELRRVGGTSVGADQQQQQLMDSGAAGVREFLGR